MILSRQLTFTALAFFSIISVFGQNKLTLNDAVLKQRTTLAPKNIQALQWVTQSESYSYLLKEEEETYLMRGTAGAEQEEKLLSLSELKKAFGKDKQPTRFPRITWLEADKFRFTFSNTLYSYQIKGGKLKKEQSLEAEADAQELHTATYNYAFVKDNNIHIRNSGGKTRQITKDGKEGIVYGQAVHRFEFGIGKGLFWSPKGNLLAFYRMDETMVTDYPLVEINATPATLRNVKYPMAGQPSHHATLGVTDANSGKTIYLQTGTPAEQYLTNICWSPDERFVYIAVVNRDQNHMQLNQYDASSGALVKTLFEERHEKYVEPEQPMIFMENVPGKFLWFSERDGYQHLYLYKQDGQLIRQLTSGKWEAHKVLGPDNNGTSIFVSGTGENPTESHVYKVNMTSGERSRVTSEAGTHNTQLSDKGTMLIDSYSSLKTPRAIQIIETDGKVIKSLLNAGNPLKDYDFPTTEIMTLPGDQSPDLYARMIKPANFDPAKKYPVIVYLYGGPHVQLVTNRWLGGAPMWMHYAAQEGFLVFTVDSRGSKNRGLDFEQATFRELGKAEMEDQMRGVEYLKSLPYVDANRLGIHGWSFGGYLTTNAMLTYPDVFKAGVAGGPVINWEYYEIMYTERYMDNPTTNPDGFKNTNLLNKAKNLKGDLLLIHGTVDDVVVWQHSLAFVKQCVDDGVQLDYFVYPGHPHNVRGKDRVHLMTKVLGYLMERL